MRLGEETVLIASVLKWFVIATVVGVVVGSSTYLFISILEWGYSVRPTYYFFTLPFALFLVALIIEVFDKNAAGYGTEKVIEAVHKYSGRINVKVVPVKMVATIVTILAGGSVGKVGPCAQIGAGLASLMADIFRLNDTDRKKIVICGISAGFSAIFGAPIAGAIFGIEVLFVGAMFYDVLLPSFVAGIIGYQTATYLGLSHPYYPIHHVMNFTETFFVEVALAGIFFGIVSIVLIEFMGWTRRVASMLDIWTPYRALIGGIVLVALGMLFSQDYFGVGEPVVESVLLGGDVFLAAFLLKILFTAITFGAGGTGGMISPLFFIGATAGYFFATLFGLKTDVFSAIGLVSLLAGAANTPITGSIMAVELFGPKIAPYAAVACIISFLITGHRSLFPTQIVAMKKAAPLEVELGKVIEEITPTVKKTPLSARLTAILERIRGLFKR